MIVDLDIFIDKVKFIYKMFDKQDDFNFHIQTVMPLITNNIPSIIFLAALFQDFYVSLD